MSTESKDAGEMLFNSGSAVLSMFMGKLIDDDKDGVEFRSFVDLGDLYTCLLYTSPSPRDS